MKKKVMRIMSGIATGLISLIFLAGCIELPKSYHENLEELEKIPWMEGYRIVTKTGLIENREEIPFDRLIIAELEAHGMEANAIKQNAYFYKGNGSYYDNLIYYCLFDEKNMVYCSIVNPSDKQVTLIYTIDSAAMDGGRIWGAEFYGATEESYVFYARIENLGGWYWIFDKATNELIEQTQEIEGKKYNKIELLDNFYNGYYYFDRIETFVLSEKEYSIKDMNGNPLEMETGEVPFQIIASDYQLTVDQEFVRSNVPEIFEILKWAKPWLGNYFLYDGYFYFVYFNQSDFFGGHMDCNMPQIVFQLDIEQKTVAYVGFADNWLFAEERLILGVAKIK